MENPYSDQLTALVTRDLPWTSEANKPLFNRRGVPPLPPAEVPAVCERVKDRLATKTAEFLLRDGSNLGPTSFNLVLETPRIEDLHALAGGIFIPKIYTQYYPDPRGTVKTPILNRVMPLLEVVQAASWHWVLSRSVSIPIPQIPNDFYAGFEQIQTFRDALPPGLAEADLWTAVTLLAAHPEVVGQRVPIIPQSYSSPSDHIFHISRLKNDSTGSQMQLVNQRGGPVTVPFVAQLRGKFDPA